MNRSGQSSTRCLAVAQAEPEDRHRPRDLLPVLLRVGAERIESLAPAMRAHARVMLEAADEIEALATESKAHRDALEISQRHLGELHRTRDDRHT